MALTNRQSLNIFLEITAIFLPCSVALHKAKKLQCFQEVTDIRNAKKNRKLQKYQTEKKLI